MKRTSLILLLILLVVTGCSKAKSTDQSHKEKVNQQISKLCFLVVNGADVYRLQSDGKSARSKASETKIDITTEYVDLLGELQRLDAAYIQLDTDLKIFNFCGIQ